MSKPRYRYGHVRILAVVLAGAACLAAAPSQAVANDYHDFLCRIPYGPQAGRPAPADGVTYEINNDFIYAEDTCSSGGSLYAQMVGETTHPFGTEARNTFTAPAGLTIAAFTLWRYEADRPGQPYGTPASNLTYRPGGPISVQGLCTEGCSRGNPADPLSSENVVSVPELSGVKEIQWSAACGGGPGGECPATGAQGSGSLSSQYDVYAADIDLVDDTPPTVSDVSGPLVAGGTLSGQQAISFNASDGQSGVYGGSLVVDGQTRVSQILDTNGGACESLGVTTDGQRSFEYAQPCESSLSASLTLNTSLLAAGQHSLELIVEDAAGNQTIAYNGTITVGGSSSTSIAPIEPCSSAALHGLANGANASDQAKLTARWVSTTKATRTNGYGAVDRITGHLTSAGGVGIAGAEVDVCETPAYDGAKTVLLATVHTGGTGQWSVTLPRDVSSAELHFLYPALQNSTLPLAMATLILRVHAGIILRIAPRVTSVGHTIVFTGTLRGVPIPPGGKQLVLEASSGGEWIQFRTISTDAKGRYRAKYRFKFPGPITYRFRVLCTHEADFPFLEGTSNVVGVFER
jgi:hypothetical protein